MAVPAHRRTSRQPPAKPISIRMVVCTIVALFGRFLVGDLARRFTLQEVRPWKAAP
jgi:hypothetical protein